MAEAGAAVVVPDDELTPQRLRARGRRAARRPGAAGRDGAGVGGAGAPGRGGRRRRRRAGRPARMSLGRAQAALHRRSAAPGMSGLALVAHALGAQVTGSDRADSAYLEPLREAGIDAGHRPRGGEHPRGRRRRGRRAPRPSRRTTPSAPPPPQRGLRELHRARAARRAQRARSARSPSPGRTARRRRARWPRTPCCGCGDGPGVPHRRRAAHDGPQRGLGGGGVARRRGRRVRPLVPAAVARALRRHERRARPPRDLRLAAEVEAAFGEFLAGGDASSSGTAPTPRRSWTARGIGEAAFFRADDVVLTPRRLGVHLARSSACASPCRARTTPPTRPRRSRRAC